VTIAVVLLSRRHQFVVQLASKPRVSIASNSPFFPSRFILCITVHRRLNPFCSMSSASLPGRVLKRQRGLESIQYHCVATFCQLHFCVSFGCACTHPRLFQLASSSQQQFILVLVSDFS
jgi:hypothetical protein